MTLLLPLKELKDNPKDIVETFRQIERWANAEQINPLRLAANWASFGGGYVAASFFKDPFDIVHLLGELQYTGTLGTTFVEIGFLPANPSPPTFAPFQAQRFNAVLNAATTLQPALIDVLSNGVIQILTGTNITNPTLSICGYTFPTFK